MQKFERLIEKEKLRPEMLEAANDTRFMKDLKETMKAFENTDQETAKGISKW